MPSPDQSSYSSLLIYDKDAYAIIQQALSDALSKLPGFSPKVGSYEMVLMESLALEIAELIYAVNRLPDGIMEVLIGNFGIDRSLGTPPSVEVTLLAVDTVGYSVPAGIELRLDDGAGNILVFVTDDPGTISTGSTTTTVTATATTNTDIYNGTGISTTLSISSPVAYLQTAQTASEISGGASPETDDQWRNRVVQLIRSLSSVLVLPDQFTNKALTIPGVFRAFTKDDWNLTVAATGHVTIAVADSAGAELTTETKAEIQATLDDQAMAALAIHVVDPNFNQIDVSVTAVKKEGYVVGDVQASIVAALQAYLSPVNWPWNGKVRQFELVSLVDNLEGVDYVTAVTLALHGGSLATADLTLVGSFPLVTNGDFAATVT